MVWSQIRIQYKFSTKVTHTHTDRRITLVFSRWDILDILTHYNQYDIMAIVCGTFAIPDNCHYGKSPTWQLSHESFNNVSQSKLLMYASNQWSSRLLP